MARYWQANCGVNITIAGGSGFIGRHLTRWLIAEGHDVSVLSRDPSRVTVGRGVRWNPPDGGAWEEVVRGSDAVVNLAGASIAGGRWTEKRKAILASSRIEPTEALAKAINGTDRRPLFISFSAVGFYGDQGDELLTESSPPGEGFLAELAVKWEAAAREAESACRLVIPRLAVVLGPDGGFLEKIETPFRLGVGGRLGSGDQYFAWVDLDDVIRFVETALGDETFEGVYNLAAPEPVRNAELTRELGRQLRRPTFFTVPRLGLKVVFGEEMAKEMFLASQRVVPERAANDGFVFTVPRIEQAIARNLGEN